MATRDQAYKDLFNMLTNEWSYTGKIFELKNPSLTWADVNAESDEDVSSIIEELSESLHVALPKNPFHPTDKIDTTIQKLIKVPRHMAA